MSGTCESDATSFARFAAVRGSLPAGAVVDAEVDLPRSRGEMVELEDLDRGMVVRVMIGQGK